MAGKKISRVNMAHIHAAADHLHAVGANYPGKGDTAVGKADMSLNDQLEVVARAVYSTAVMPMDGYCCIEETFDSYVIIEVCQSGAETYYRADYSMAGDGSVTLAARDSWVEVEEVWQPVTNTGKAGVLKGDASTLTPYASIKALADRHLEVKVSYYGHKNGKDSHEEFFSGNTDFAAEDFPTPPLLYYHGFDANGKKMGKPVTTGKFVSRRAGADGHYLTYQLKNNKYADRQWDSALKGECVVSPGTVGHLIRKAANGELLYWPLAEISAWDYAPNRAPANLHSVAAPVLKALYISEGLSLPTSIDTEASESPEALGDSASGQAQSSGVDISPDDAAPVIAAEVARILLDMHHKETPE